MSVNSIVINGKQEQEQETRNETWWVLEDIIKIWREGLR